jgi:hypothetical protein
MVAGYRHPPLLVKMSMSSDSLDGHFFVGLSYLAGKLLSNVSTSNASACCDVELAEGFTAALQRSCTCRASQPLCFTAYQPLKISDSSISNGILYSRNAGWVKAMNYRYDSGTRLET